MKLNTIIVEDEQLSRDILRAYLAKYCPNINVLGQAENINEGLKLINKHDLDLVFLDVEMPYGTAFDLLDNIENRTFETIFVTAYNHYAKDALNAHASYYLMKPIEIDELIKAVNYVTEIKEKEQSLQDQVLVPIAQTVDGKITVPQQLSLIHI